MITFANLYGNTLDALLERLKLRPVQGSRLFDEISVLSAGATVVPVGLLIGLIARRLKVAGFHHRVRSSSASARFAGLCRKLRVNHD